MALQFRPVTSGPSGSVTPSRGEMLVPFSLADANLDASASPLTEPPKPQDLRQRMIERLIAAGMDPAAAVRTVDADLARNAETAPMSEELFDANNTPQRNAALGARLAAGNRADKQMADFASDYNDATGAPAADSPLEDTGRAAREYHARAPYNAELEMLNHPGGFAVAGGGAAGPRRPAGTTAPGPRTLDGRTVRAPQPLDTPEDVAAYATRQPRQLSQQDRDMGARGMVPVVTPDGVRYMVSAATGGGGDGPLFPGGPGRAGAGRPDLEAKGWVPQDMVGPDGVKRQVYAPGPGMRQAQAADLKQREQAYKTKKAGRDAEREKARQLWRATAMLARGSQNINGGNGAMFSQLAMLPEAQRNTVMQGMMPMDPHQAAVAAQNMQNANDVIRRFMTSGAAAGFGGPMAEAQAEIAGLQAQTQRNEMRAGDEDVLGEKYARGGMFGYDEFTIDEQQQMYDDLIGQGYQPGEAQRAVDRQAIKRRASKPMDWNAPGA